MKTLIFNGSPRQNGDTVFMIKELIKYLKGEYKIVNTYKDNISPCIDCRKCRKYSGCAINDDMQEIYKYIELCDNIIIASPIYFSELTGKMLDTGSRFQTFFSAQYFRNEKIIEKQKKGAVLLAGGGTGNPEKAYQTAKCLMRYMNVNNIFPLICSHNTDNIHTWEDTQISEKIKALADFLSI